MWSCGVWRVVCDDDAARCWDAGTNDKTTARLNERPNGQTTTKPRPNPPNQQNVTTSQRHNVTTSHDACTLVARRTSVPLWRRPMVSSTDMPHFELTLVYVLWQSKNGVKEVASNSSRTRKSCTFCRLTEIVFFPLVA